MEEKEQRPIGRGEGILRDEDWFEGEHARIQPDLGQWNKETPTIG